jgi:hypothetical protein
LFQLLNRKSMFAAMHPKINSLQSGLFHLTGQPNRTEHIRHLCRKTAVLRRCRYLIKTGVEKINNN